MRLTLKLLHEIGSVARMAATTCEGETEDPTMARVAKEAHRVIQWTNQEIQKREQPHA